MRALLCEEQQDGHEAILLTQVCGQEHLKRDSLSWTRRKMEEDKMGRQIDQTTPACTHTHTHTHTHHTNPHPPHTPNHTTPTTHPRACKDRHPHTPGGQKDIHRHM